MKTTSKIAITGAAGFIGSRLVELFNKGEKAQLISVDYESFFQERKEHQGLKFGKIVDRSQFLEWLNKESPELDAIFHLGAITDTRETNQSLLNQFNLDYTKQLWNFATKHRIPLIYASSAATYGDGSLGYDDNEDLIPKLKPLNPYGQSKQDFDIWALDQERKGNHPPIWTGFKFFNVYGYGERHKQFMSSVVLHSFDQIRETSEVKLFKSHKEGIPDGHQKRDFVFVDDVVEVMLFALTHPIKRGIFNLGTGHARTFLDLARATFKAMQSEERIRFIDTPLSIRDKYQYFTEARMDRLRAQGYTRPFTELEAGVKDYVNRLLS